MCAAVMGYHEYPRLLDKFGIPMVVTGFEPLDLARGILETVQLLESGTVAIRNVYPRAVNFEGNLEAQRLITQVFEECDRAWRGIGVIPRSGWRLRPAYHDFDAERRFDVASISAPELALCIAGQILQGHKKPRDCRGLRPRVCARASVGSNHGVL